MFIGVEDSGFSGVRVWVFGYRVSKVGKTMVQHTLRERAEELFLYVWGSGREEEEHQFKVYLDPPM